jgi:hypothetical protein
MPIADGADSHRRVDPSTSVNKNVTVPEGAATPTVSHAATRRAPTPGSGVPGHQQPLVPTRASFLELSNRTTAT